MLDEMRFLFKRREDLASEEIFRMATRNGAAALNSGGSLGCLRCGRYADIAILEFPPTLKSRRFLDQVLEGAGENVATLVQGRMAWQKSSKCEVS
jgi:cytosine/adenosine deaminase-related metal-dependent hydrolase